MHFRSSMHTHLHLLQDDFWHSHPPTKHQCSLHVSENACDCDKVYILPCSDAKWGSFFWSGFPASNLYRLTPAVMPTSTSADAKRSSLSEMTMHWKCSFVCRLMYRVTCNPTTNKQKMLSATLWKSSTNQQPLWNDGKMCQSSGHTVVLLKCT